MTPKIIELKQAPVVLVEMPEKENIGELELIFDHPLMGGNHKANLLNNKRFIGVIGFANDFDENSVIGILSDLTEEQICEVLNIDFCDICPLEKKGVYGTDGGYMSGCEGSRCDDVRDVLHVRLNELLESENVYTENPYGEKPNCGCYTDYDREGCADECYKWINAQSRTIDPKRTIVLIRKEDK